MKILSGVLFISLILSGGRAATAADNDEIEFLLKYISDSGRTFIRNSKEYGAKQVREHLEMKYDHVQSHFKTAEDFINTIASKSSISRKQYTIIRCEGSELSTKQ